MIPVYLSEKISDHMKSYTLVNGDVGFRSFKSRLANGVDIWTRSKLSNGNPLHRSNCNFLSLLCAQHNEQCAHLT